MNTVKVDLTEREYTIIRSILLDAIDSPKHSLSVKNELDDLRSKLSLANCDAVFAERNK
jgi:hypothetical protein